MKKYFLLLGFVLFLFSSCGYFTGLFEYEIINKSSEVVQINIEDVGTYTLNPAENLKLKFYNANKISLINNPRASLRKECKEAYAYFYVYIENLEYKNMQFFNFSDFDVEISEKNGLLGDKYGDILLVKAKEVKKAKVFTREPTFISTFADSRLPADNVISFGEVPN